MQAHQAPVWVNYVITAGIVVVVFALRLRRVNQTRPLRLGRLWVVPAIFGAIVAVSFGAQPPSGTGWLACVAGLFVGAALGWQRGKTIAIHVDPATGELNQKTSIASLAFVFVLIVAKSAARAGGTAMHVNIATLTDALMALALGTFTIMRIEMYLRAKRLIASARTAEATALL